MLVATYLKDNQMKIKFKFHHFAKQFQSSYKLIHHNVISMFHREKNRNRISIKRSELGLLLRRLLYFVVFSYSSKSFCSLSCWGVIAILRSPRANSKIPPGPKWVVPSWIRVVKNGLKVRASRKKRLMIHERKAPVKNYCGDNSYSKTKKPNEVKHLIVTQP